MRSISWRIFVRLAITTVLTSMFAYGWIYWQAQSTEIAVRQRALLNQATHIASYIHLDERGEPTLKLPQAIVDSYSSTTGAQRYAIRDQDGTVLFGSGRGEELMTLSTSDVAVCCSSASLRSSVR